MEQRDSKRCDKCGASFTAEEFVESPNLIPIGMMFFGEEHREAFYLFQHETDDCGSSVLIRAAELRAFVTESFPEQFLCMGEHCERHCVDLNDTADCQQDCGMAPYRRFLSDLIERKWQAHVQSRT